jgi:hypothetical protein
MELAAGQSPHRHAVGQEVEIGARAAATQTHGRLTLIEHLRDNGAGGSSHRRRYPFVDTANGLTDNQSLLGVGEKEDNIWIKSKFSKRAIYDMSHVTPHQLN